MNPYVKGSETSEAAAKSIKTDKGRAAVLAVLRQHPGGLTDEEIQGLTGLSPSTERPRRVELWRSGVLKDSGVRRPTSTGRYAVIWVACTVAPVVEPDGSISMPFEHVPTWKNRALLAEAACDALRRQIDELQKLLAAAQKQPVPNSFFDFWGVPRSES